LSYFNASKTASKNRSGFSAHREIECKCHAEQPARERSNKDCSIREHAVSHCSETMRPPLDPIEQLSSTPPRDGACCTVIDRRTHGLARFWRIGPMAPFAKR
jgi:hypothetical protein